MMGISPTEQRNLYSIDEYRRLVYAKNVKLGYIAGGIQNQNRLPPEEPEE